MTVYILKGLGIECELECRNIFSALCGQENVKDFWIFDLLDGHWPDQEAGSLWVLPGGFSFSDHFGAGRLLAFKLKKIGFIENIIKYKQNVLGICNGFQVLCHLNVFGEKTRLLKNKQKRFVNKWVDLENTNGNQFRMPVRHGEGCLQGFDPELGYLKYVDFDNGSQESVAALKVLKQNSCFLGMMPHPEIAIKSYHMPEFVGAVYPTHNSERFSEEKADGYLFLKSFIEELKTSCRKENEVYDKRI